MKSILLKVCIFFFTLLAVSGKICAQKTMYRTLGHQTEGSEGRNVAEAADGGYFLTSYIYFASQFVACVTKMNCAGVKEWEKFYSEGTTTLPVEIIPQSDN